MSPLPPISNAILNASSRVSDAGANTSSKEENLRKQAAFEAMFVAEMLSQAGFDKALSQNSGLGGDMFSRMLVDSYASELVKGKGLGIAEKIYNQLKDRQS